MREEQALSNSVMTFENLEELLALLDESIETHSKMIKRYEDRLGVLLRLARESNDPRLQSVSAQIPMPTSNGGDSDPSATAANAAKKDDKKKNDKKKEGPEEKGWIVLESEDLSLKIASGTEVQLASNEISILFKTIETLKSKIAPLESSRKLLSELPSQGFKADRRIRIVFKDSIPKYVLPTTDAQNTLTKKFRYGEAFRIAVLK
jgi:hypothetical protein